MNTPEFKDAYEKLNPEQRMAVDVIEGPVMVVAGPGTGKTQVLTLRIANILLKTDTRPENILALTFTEAAATNMRKRLQKLIGLTAYRVVITTFHSFCNDIIQRYPEYFPRIAGARNLTQVEATEAVEQIVLNMDLKILRPWGDPTLYVGDIIRKIEELKREGLDPEEFESLVDKKQKDVESRGDLYHEKGAYKGRMKGEFADELRKVEKNKELALIYKEYQKTLFEKRHYDYSDMILEVLNALREQKAESEKHKVKTEEKENELKQILQENHQYILVDEHQDTNQAQNKILEIICDFHEEPNIFVVGDVKQAIFRFQGASIENFLYFKNKYKSAKLMELFRNYRSTQSILDVAFSLTTESVELKAQNTKEGESIKVASFKNETIENYWVANQVKDIGGETAIIYRQNKDAFPMSLALKKCGIPHVIESDEDLLSEKYVSKLLAILYAVNHLGDDNYIVDALHLEEFGIDPVDAYKLLRRASKEGKSVYEVETEGRCMQVLNLFKNWSKSAQEEEVTVLLEKMLRESGILNSMITSRDAEAFLGIEKFFDEAKTFSLNNGGAKLKALVNYLDIIKSHKIFIRRPRTGNGECPVRLMTAHRAKGLEFDNVFIIGATDRSFGPRARREKLPLIDSVYDQKGKDNTPDDEVKENSESDERRLFYVALTRAKKSLFITYSERDPEGREALPSPFIGEIRADRLQVVDTREFEDEIENDKSVLYSENKVKNVREVDKQFVNELWQSHILSVTALNNYLECPWKYFYRNLLRIPEVQEKYLIYGSCMHAAVEDMFKSGRKEKEYLLNSFERHLMGSVLSKKEKEDALERGRQALSVWFDERKPSWQSEVMIEFPIKCVEVSGVQIGGKLDKVEIVKGNEVIVTDYKTGRAKSRNEIEGKTKDSNGDIKRQLVFYQLLLDTFDSGRYKMQKGRIEFLEPTDSGNIKIEDFEITLDEVDELKETIKRVAKEVTDLDFWDKTCGEKDCKWCAYRKLI